MSDECCICYENKDNCIKDICDSCKLMICQECSDKINAMCPVCKRTRSLLDIIDSRISPALFSVVSGSILAIFFNNGYFDAEIVYFLQNEIFISFVNEIITFYNFDIEIIRDAIFRENSNFQHIIISHPMYPRVIEALESFLQN